MDLKKGYYSTEGALNYNRFLNHFRNQAQGTGKPVIINAQRNPPSRKMRNSKALVLVDTAERDGESKGSGSRPKVEIVDPNEAEKRRAVGEMAQQKKDQSRDATQKKAVKRRSNHPKQHSTAGNRQVKRSSNSSGSKVKRVKDIFD